MAHQSRLLPPFKEALRIEFTETRQTARFADRLREFIERGVADPFVKISSITEDENDCLICKR